MFLVIEFSAQGLRVDSAVKKCWPLSLPSPLPLLSLPFPSLLLSSPLISTLLSICLSSPPLISSPSILSSFPLLSSPHLQSSTSFPSPLVSPLLPFVSPPFLSSFLFSLLPSAPPHHFFLPHFPPLPFSPLFISSLLSFPLFSLLFSFLLGAYRAIPGDAWETMWYI